ncbi:hypothetical protein GEMRC1_005750 [Eukaryota sp. GEM-RC1]
MASTLSLDWIRDSPAFVVAFSSDLIVVEASTRFISRLQYDRLAVIGSPVGHFSHPEDRNILRQVARRATEKKFDSLIEGRLITKTSTVLWFKWTVLTWLPDGICIAVAEDKTQDRLAFSDFDVELLKVSLSVAKIGLFSVHLPSDTALMNHFISELLGGNPASFQWSDFLSSIRNPLREEFLATLHSVASTKVPIETTLTLESFSGQLQTVIVYLESDPKIEDKVLGTVRDVTKIEVAHQRLRDTIDNLLDGVLVFEEEMLITFNKKSIEMGFVPKCHYLENCHCSLTFQDLRKIIAEKFSLRDIDGIFELQNSTARFHGEFQTKTNEFYFIDVIRTHNSPNRVVVVIKEITDLKLKEIELIKASENAKTADNAKTMFLSSTSHEIRTPLTCIIGLVSVLKDTQLDLVQSEMISIIETSSNSLLSLINDILDFSKIVSGKIALEFQTFKISNMMDDIIGPFRGGLIQTKDFPFLYFLDPNLDNLFTGDQTRIRQIITNLVGNAIKFTQAGYVMVSACLIDPHGVMTSPIRFTVTDTGIGIKPEFVPIMFQPFSQDRTQNSKGTGLGLSISDRLARIMGSEIKFESEQSKGSVFWFDLSLPRVSSCETSKHYPKTTVFVFIKSEKQAENLEKQLESLNCTALIFYSINKEIIEKMIESKPKAILVHLNCQQVFLSLIQNHQLFDHFKITLIFDSASRGSISAEVRSIVSYCFSLPLVYHEYLCILFDHPVSRLTSKDYDALKPSNAERYHVLVADDNPINRTTIRFMMKQLNVDCTTVDDGQSAVSCYCQSPIKFDVVFLDYHMPVSGPTAAIKIRRFEEHVKLQGVPIVGLTADVLESTKQECLASGMTEFMGKPFSKSELLTTLTRILPSPSGEREYFD